MKRRKKHYNYAQCIRLSIIMGEFRICAELRLRGMCVRVAMGRRFNVSEVLSKNPAMFCLFSICLTRVKSLRSHAALRLRSGDVR